MQNSLAKRLTYRIMIVVVVMLAFITGFVYFSVRNYMLDEAQGRYEGILHRMQEETRRRLSDIYVAARNNVHDIERDIDNPDMMYDHMERIVRMNPGVKSSAILFLPNYYPGKKSTFTPMVRRDSTGRTYIAKTDSVYGYYHAPWYQDCLKSDTGIWVGAHFEPNRVSDANRRTMLTTYATPVHNHQGKPVGLLCLQLSLQSMHRDFIREIKKMNDKYEKGHKRQSYCFIIDHHGRYIMHPDESRLLNDSIQKQVKETPDSLDDRVVAKMVKEGKGEAMMDVDGMHAWVYYRTVKYVNWTMAIVVPEEVIFYNGRMLNTMILAVMLIGLLAIYFFCRRMIRDVTTPVTAAQAALERELKIAHDIQMAMLPKTFPPFPERIDIDLYASETPALDVGGDLYDYFLRDNRLFFCIGDVSGKGMPAALMMAVMRSMFRSETRRADSAVALVETMNRNLSEESTAGYFVTMFVGILDLHTGHLDYCNAGHEAPLLAGQPLPVKPNLPIGALADWNYEAQEVQLNDGDMLFLYTDGLSEAKNHANQQFGRQNVLELARQHIGDTAQQLVQLMENEVHRHAADVKQSDDITLLAIKWYSSRLSMKSAISEIGCLKPYIERVTQRVGIDEKQSKRLRLAVEEAVANVINYSGATTVTLSAALRPLIPELCSPTRSLSSFPSPLSSLLSPLSSALEITIDDDGQPFDPTEGSATDLSVPPDQRPPGGLGIMLLQKMTDGQEYQRVDGHNILTLWKTIKS